MNHPDNEMSLAGCCVDASSGPGACRYVMMAFDTSKMINPIARDIVTAACEALQDGETGVAGIVARLPGKVQVKDVLTALSTPIALDGWVAYCSGINREWAGRMLRQRAEQLLQIADSDLEAAVSLAYRLPDGLGDASRFDSSFDGVSWSPESLAGITTGYNEIDRVIKHGGWPCGHVSVVLSMSGGGKSTFLVRCAALAAKAGAKAAIASFEMRKEELFAKLVQQESGYSSPPGGEAQSAFNYAQQVVRDLKLSVFDTMSANKSSAAIEDVVAWIAAKVATGTQIFFIDHFQLLQSKAIGVYDKGVDVSKRLLAAAATHNVPIIVGSQRTVSEGGGTTTKGGSTLLEDATLVIELTKEGVMLKKNRFSVRMASGSLALRYNPAMDRFEE